MLSKRLRPELVLLRPGLDALTLTCLMLLGCYVVTSFLGGYAANAELYYEVGLTRPGVLMGKVWQVGTYALLHGNWTHFLVNGLMIYLLGGKVVHILGGRMFLKIFWGGVLLGGGFHLVLQPALPLGLAGEVVNAPLVGASAGAMALLLALTSLSPQSRMWPLPVSGRNLQWGILISAALLYLCTPGLRLPLFSQIGAWAVSHQLAEIFQMAHACHFGGGVWGLFVAHRLLGKPITLAGLQKDRAKRDAEMAA